MKLLFDENLSPRLVELLVAEFPDSTHVELLGMRGCADSKVWDHAHTNGYAIVSKDSDFRQRLFLYGSPPKVIWLSVGNAGTDVVASLLRANIGKINRFAKNHDEGLLVLEANPDSDE